MQIIGIEQGGALECLEIGDRECLAAQGPIRFAAHSSCKCPVDMDRRQPARIPRDRPGSKAVRRCCRRRGRPPATGRNSSQNKCARRSDAVRCPRLTFHSRWNRRGHQRVPPKARGRSEDISSVSAVSASGSISAQVTGRQRSNRMIHLAQQGKMLRSHMSPGNKEGHDLAAPILQRLVAAAPSRQDDVEVVGPVALANDVIARRHGLHPLAAQRGEDALVADGQRG